MQGPIKKYKSAESLNSTQRMKRRKAKVKKMAEQIDKNEAESRKRGEPKRSISSTAATSKKDRPKARSSSKRYQNQK